MRILAGMTALLVACTPPTPGADGGSPDLAQPSNPTGLRTGLVMVQSNTAVGPLPAAASAAAQFSEFPAGMAAVEHTSSLGACVLTIVESASATGNKPRLAKTAGTVTISGGKKTVTLSGQSTFTDTMPLWNGGETLTIMANGADVPAFTSQATAPSQVVVTAPVPTTSAMPTVAVDRTKDWTIAWTGGSAGSVRISLRFNTFQPGVYMTLLDCSYPSAGNSATIPQAVLQQLPQGASGTIEIGAGGTQNVTAGDYAVSVSVQGYATWSTTGTPASASLQLN